jgi:hypothetical protein
MPWGAILSARLKTKTNLRILQVATEAIQSIKTVQSLSIERLFYEKYLEHLLPVYL